MIHAREDYNRFQEPKELMEEIYWFAACIQTGQLPTKDQIDEKLKYLNGKYKKFSGESTPFGEDEPVMLFRAKDKYFTSVLEHYASELDPDIQVDSRMLDAVMNHIELAEKWQAKNGKKTPDVPSIVLDEAPKP